MKSEEARSVRAHNTTQHRHACFALNDAIQILLRTSTSAFCIASCLFFTHSFHSLIPSSCSGQWAQSGRASRLQRASLVVHHVFNVHLWSCITSSSCSSFLNVHLSRGSCWSTGSKLVVLLMRPSWNRLPYLTRNPKQLVFLATATFNYFVFFFIDVVVQYPVDYFVPYFTCKPWVAL